MAQRRRPISPRFGFGGWFRRSQPVALPPPPGGPILGNPESAGTGLARVAVAIDGSLGPPIGAFPIRPQLGGAQ